jgi:hypothetical protein
MFASRTAAFESATPEERLARGLPGLRIEADWPMNLLEFS